MRTEFVVALRNAIGDDVWDDLAGFLVTALEEHENDFDDERVAYMLTLTHVCEADAGGSIWGFFVDLPEEVEQPRLVMDAFIEGLADSEDVRHVARFEDDGLRDELRAMADEVFAVEMKARRALTYAYLRASVGDHPYDILREDQERTQTKNLQPSAMRAMGENPLFHLGFAQYGKLNRRKKMDLDVLLSALASAGDFDELKAELSRTPIQHEDDELLIAGLKDSVETLEQLRNSIAHSRRLSRKLLENAPRALESTHARLDGYLETLIVRLGGYEPD